LSFVYIINNIVWSPVLLVFFILSGIYFSCKTHFFQITRCKTWLKYTLFSLFDKKSHDNGKKISSFEAVCTSLGASIGTGNIVGVATSITMGGPGAVFWLLVSSVFSMMLIFFENYLGALYRYKNKQTKTVNGAYAYMEKGLNAKWMGVIYALLTVLTSFGMGNMAQSNSISTVIYESFKVPPLITGLSTAILIGIILFGGLKRIAKISAVLVPFMGIMYIAGGLIVIIFHIREFTDTVKYILSCAFSFKSVSGGLMGYGITQAVKYGVSRGVFTNEAGIGTSLPLLGANENETPVKQGMWGIFQVFIDTIVICSITALAILMSKAYSPDSDVTGALLCAKAFGTVFGKFSDVFITVSITLFAFATLASFSVLGFKAMEYIFKKDHSFLYTVLYLFFIVMGSINSVGIVFEISDIFNGLMAIINLTALLLLRKKINIRNGINS